MSDEEEAGPRETNCRFLVTVGGSCRSCLPAHHV